MTPIGEYHDNFDAANDRAKDALSREAQPCLFDRLDWYEQLHATAFLDRKVALIGARMDMAQCWLALTRQSAGHLVSLSNWYSFSWAPAFANARTEITRLALLRTAAREVGRLGWRLTLEPVPDEDGAAELVETAFAQEGWLVRREMCDENHVLHVKGRTFDAYWEGRPGQLRSTVRRKGKKGIVSIRIDRQFSTEAWADYESVYRRSWKPEEGSPEFLRALAEQESVAGTLRLGLAYIDGEPVAAQFWTVENGRALIHKLAHDEDHIRASPGTLLSAALFQHVIDRDGVAIVDFGTGNDGYKRDWMEEMRPRYRLDLFRPAHPASWPYIVRNWLKDRTSAPSKPLAAAPASD